MTIPKSKYKDSKTLLAYINKQARKLDRAKRPKLVRVEKTEILGDDSIREDLVKPKVPDYWQKKEIPKVMPAHPKYGKQFIKGYGYAFYLDDGTKLIGQYWSRKYLFKNSVHLWAKNSETGEFTKYVVPRSRVNFDPWASVPDVPREAPPPALKFESRYLPRYANAGQSKAKGILMTPAIKRLQERDNQLS